MTDYIGKMRQFFRYQHIQSVGITHPVKTDETQKKKENKSQPGKKRKIRKFRTRLFQQTEYMYIDSEPGFISHQNDE